MGKVKIEVHMQIKIMTNLIATGELKSALEEQIGETEGLRLELPKTDTARGFDPTFLVALVGVGSTALGALLGGIFKIMEAKQGRTIVINGSKGRRVELKGTFTKEEIEEAVRQAREIDAEQI